MSKKYDFLIVGAGLFGATCAYELTKSGFTVLVIDKRNHVGGNCYTENKCGINVHKYGAHIFHCNDSYLWEYINSFAKFNNFINSPIADFNGERYHLPFNMNTFCEMWNDVKTPDDAKNKIDEEIKKYGVENPTNLEEQAISLVGKSIYEKLIKEYTEKQWGRSCKELPPEIIKRIPVRFEFNNNYFNDKYQGIPIGGYTQIIDKMLAKSDVMLNTNFFGKRDFFKNIAEHIIYTGSIDEYFCYAHGKLEYRTVKFIEKELAVPNFQGNAVVNYTSKDKPYTRIIEHKHFEFGNQKTTIISEEYPLEFSNNCEPFYPINNCKNKEMLDLYFNDAAKEKNVYFGGRLAQYKYFDMDDTILEAFKLIKKIKGDLKR